MTLVIRTYKPGDKDKVWNLHEVALKASGAFRKISDTVAEIKRMRVDPDFQRMGFGQQIYDELEKRATAKGYKKFVLDTTVVQKSAQKFYLKNGFVETGRKTLPVSFSDSGLEFIYYEKNLV